MALGVHVGRCLFACSVRRARNTAESSSRLHRVIVAFPATVVTFSICQRQPALPKQRESSRANLTAGNLAR
jgi:hypothetical protein